jgi:Domain of unknown function (DUF3471)
MISKGIHKSENPRILYPSIPSPIVPLTLPLHSYAGTYQHPAYGKLTICIDLSGPLSSTQPSAKATTYRLFADRSQKSWPEQITFEHVSGEFFVARSKHSGDFGELFDDIYPVEFKIGSDGKVKEVGVRWEESMGTEKIWLSRVAHDSN